MQVYALKMFNFFRFGEKNNSVVFDPPPELVDKVNDPETDFGWDDVYEWVVLNPIQDRSLVFVFLHFLR